MGVKLGDALVFIRGDKSKLGDDLGSAEKETKSWASRLGGTTKKLVGTAILGGAAMATTAVVGIGAAALNASSAIRGATNQIQTQLGLSEAEAAEFGDTIKKVYGDNFGESIEDVGQALIDTRNQMSRFGQMSQEELGAATERALALRDAFGTEVGESTQAVNALMENFGLTSAEAFDFVTAGMQAGLNNSGDFLDTIGEYSVQFRDSGATAAEFFSVMDTGLQAGMLGTDKAADMFKEFRLRIQDGSESTAQALENIGLSVEDVQQGLADGSMTIMDVYRDVSKGIRFADDEQMAFQAGTALLGSQFEDLGETAMGQIDTLALTMDDIGEMAGDVGAQYDNFGDKFEGIKRKALMALTPLGDKLLDIADRAMPHIERAFDWFALQLPMIMDVAEQAMAQLWPWLEEFLPVALEYLSDLWFNTLLPAIQAFVDFETNVVVPALIELYQWVLENIVPALQEFAAWLQEHVPIALAALRTFIVESVIPAIQMFAAWLSENLPVAFQAVSDVWNSVLQPALTTIGDFILNSVIPAISTIATWLQANIPVAFAAVQTAWNDVLSPALTNIKNFIEDPLIPIVSDIVSWFQDNLPVAFEAIQTAWNEVLSPALTEVHDFVKDPLIPIVSDIVSWFQDNLPVAFDAVQTAWSEVLKPILQKVHDFIKDPLLPIVGDVIDKIGGGIEGGFKIAKDAWETILKPAIEAIIDTIEGIVGAVDDALSALQDLATGLGEYLPTGQKIDVGGGFGGQSWGEVPGAQEGGYLMRLHPNEVILPIDSPETINTLAGALAGAIRDLGLGGGPTFQLEAHYANYQSESSLRDDIRMMQILGRGE